MGPGHLGTRKCGWVYDPDLAAVAYRGIGGNPDSRFLIIGFRLVRSSGN